MKQEFIKRNGKPGDKNALLKKGSSHIIYIMEAPLLPIWPRNSILVCPQPPNSSMKMCEDNYINDYGKLETSSGRHPSLYGLNPESGYFIGVDIKKFAINIGLDQFKGICGNQDEHTIQVRKYTGSFGRTVCTSSETS